MSIDETITVNEVAALEEIVAQYERAGLTQRHNSEARRKAADEKRENVRIAKGVLGRLQRAALMNMRTRPSSSP